MQSHGHHLVVLINIGVPQHSSWVLDSGSLEMTAQISELGKDHSDLGHDLVILTNIGVPQHCSWILGPGMLREQKVEKISQQVQPGSLKHLQMLLALGRK